MSARASVALLLGALALAGCGEKAEPDVSRPTAVTGTLDLARSTAPANPDAGTTAGHRAPDATASTTRSALAFTGRIEPGSARVTLAREDGQPAAVAGQAGVREVLENLRAELDLTMALAGCHSLAEVGPETLRDVAG